VRRLLCYLADASGWYPWILARSVSEADDAYRTITSPAQVGQASRLSLSTKTGGTPVPPSQYHWAEGEAGTFDEVGDLPAAGIL
jgi:hypothetical protein